MVKFKSRYLLVETLYDSDSITNIDSGRMAALIKNQVELLFGDVGVGGIIKNLQVKYVNNYTNLTIIRVGKDFINLLWTALILLNNIDGVKVRMHVIGVSGTIKKCELKAKSFLEKWLINYENNK